MRNDNVDNHHNNNMDILCIEPSSCMDNSSSYMDSKCSHCNSSDEGKKYCDTADYSSNSDRTNNRRAATLKNS
uniref:Uncharacterized protein n=1 Tax=Setaria digitata TaxID=48799 RepID=A0A915PV87_9BILA